MLFVLTSLVILVPLLITPRLLFHYDVTPKIIVLNILVAAGCIARPCVAALWRRKSGRWLCGVAAAQILWYAVASALSMRPWFSLLGSNWRRMGLLTIVALSVFAVLAGACVARKPEALNALLKAFAAATVLASIYGILQYFDIDPLQAPAGYHAEAGASTIVRPPGTLGHADYFGWWLAIAMFCGVALVRLEKGLWKRLAVAACVLSGVAIVMSGTRSAMLAVAAGFVSLAVLSGFWPSRKHVVAGALAAGLLVAFYFSPAGVRLQARVRWSSDEPIGGARPLLWRDSLRMAATRPLTGFGPETFPSEFPRYQSVELSRLLPDFYHESPHNLALDALTGSGIPGLVIALAWMALGLGAGLRQRAQHPACPALVAALAASGVASMFGAATAGPVLATLFVIAMLAGLAPEDLTSEATGGHAVVRPLARVISLPIAACLAIFGVLLAVADFRLGRFQRESGDTARAMALYDAASRAALPGAGEDLYSSRRLATLCGVSSGALVRDSGTIRSECARTATRAAARATSSADNPPNAWYNVGMFSAEQNDAAKVEVALRTSESLAPNWFKPHWALANFLALTGRVAEARGEAERAFALDAGKDPEVSQTLARLPYRTP
jgi:O-antigen ligase